jgi:MFS family permease
MRVRAFHMSRLTPTRLGVGALCASWISYGTYVGFPDTNTAQWRVPLGIQVIPAVILGCLIFLFPESPRWLIDHGHNEWGLRVLAKLHAHGNTDDAWVLAEYDQIREALAFEHEHEAKSYKELFTNKSAFRRLFLAVALQASIQMTGVSAIQYYSVSIYAQVGITGEDTLKYQAINSIIALVAQALCIAFVDKFGRRWPLILGNLFNCLTFIIACILIAVYPASVDNIGAHWGFIIMTWLYNFSFSATCGPLCKSPGVQSHPKHSKLTILPAWVIPAEIFDTHTRSKGVSIATMTSFAFK